MTYSTVLSALADDTRRTIFERVARTPSAVGEIAAKLPISQPAVSQHLRVLREAGLVEVRPDGTRHVHHANPAGLQSLRDYLDGFWGEVLKSFERAAQAEVEKQREKKKGKNKRKGKKPGKGGGSQR